MKNNKPKTNQQRSVADSVPMKMEQFLTDVYVPFESGLLEIKDETLGIQQNIYSMFKSFCKYYKLELTVQDDVQQAWDKIYDLKIYPDLTQENKGLFQLGRKRNEGDGEKDIVSARSPSRLQDRKYASLKRVKSKTLKFSTLDKPSLNKLDIKSVCQQIENAFENSEEDADIIRRNLRDAFADLNQLIRSLLKDNESMALEFSEMFKDFVVSLRVIQDKRQKETMALLLDAKAVQVSTRKRATNKKVA